MPMKTHYTLEEAAERRRQQARERYQRNKSNPEFRAKCRASVNASYHRRKANLTPEEKETLKAQQAQYAREYRARFPEKFLANRVRAAIKLAEAHGYIVVRKEGAAE